MCVCQMCAIFFPSQHNYSFNFTSSDGELSKYLEQLYDFGAKVDEKLFARIANFKL